MSAHIGFDIGGTSVKYLLMNSRRDILMDGSFPTHGIGGPEEVIRRMILAVRECERKQDLRVKSVGIGCTGPVDISTGVIYNPYTLSGFEGHSLSVPLRRELSVPVVIENDANCAHLGEVEYRKEKEGNTMMIAFGTGIGVSIRMGGKLYRTAGSIHPEIGHMGISVSSPGVCYCGRTHCFEHVMSGTAINRYAKEVYGTSPEHILDGTDRVKAEELLDRMVTATVDAVSTLAIMYAPSVVYLGGGLHSFIGRYVLSPAQQRLDRLLPEYGRTILVETGQGPLAGSLGAAILGAEQI